MATDYAKLTQNLSHFYDFTDKVVLFIGAAGGQLLDRGTRMRKLIAIDKDVKDLQELKAKIVGQGLQDSVEVVGTGFEEVTLHGDAVYFEFCLHEMDDPRRALTHAKRLAPDIVVYDHSPGSEWIYYSAEEDKVCGSFAAMEQVGIRRRQTFHAKQRFGSYRGLLAKVTSQGRWPSSAHDASQEPWTS